MNLYFSIMQKQYRKLFSFVINVVIFSLIIFQNSFAGISAVDELVQLLSNIHTMRANFEQSLVNQNDVRIGTKTIGKMFLVRPVKFRWEIVDPNNQLIIVNKDRMFLYDSDLTQLIKRKVDYSTTSNPAILLGSSVESLKQSFQITKLKNQDQGSWFKLTPKKQKNLDCGYKWVKIHFINERLNAMYIFDNLEQVNLIKFNNVIIDSKIPIEKFTFVPPKNTEIFNSE